LCPDFDFFDFAVSRIFNNCIILEGLFMKTKLILGAAGHANPDAVTLDIDPRHNPDVVWNLNKTPWPFENNQFKEIICHHVIEHLEELNPAMDELYRICSMDGEIYIEVPYRSSWLAFDPQHKLIFGYFSLDGYINGGSTKWMNTERKFKLLERKITFHKAYRRYFLHKIFNKIPLAYERFWAYIMPAEHLIFRLQPIKIKDNQKNR